MLLVTQQDAARSMVHSKCILNSTPFLSTTAFLYMCWTTADAVSCNHKNVEHLLQGVVNLSSKIIAGSN